MISSRYLEKGYLQPEITCSLRTRQMQIISQFSINYKGLGVPFAEDEGLATGQKLVFD